MSDLLIRPYLNKVSRSKSSFNNSIAYIICNEIGEIIYYNYDTVKILGIKPNGNIENWISNLPLYNGNNLPLKYHQTSIYNCFKTRLVQKAKLVQLKESNNIKWIKLFSAPYFDELNEFKGVVVLFFDVTHSYDKQKAWITFGRNKKALINASPNLLWSVDSNYKLITANEKFYSYFKEIGKTIHVGDSLKTAASSLQSFEKWKRYFDKALNGESFFIEHILEGGKSKNAILEIGFHPIFTESGKVIGLACIANDISRLKNQEKQITHQNSHLINKTKRLEQITQEYRKIMESSVDIICTINKYGKFQQISNAIHTILGYDAKELKGKSIFSIIHPSSLEKTKSICKQALKGNTFPNFENICISKTGQNINMLWSINWDDKTRVMYCIGKDATALKKSEQERAKAEKYLAALVENGADMVGIIDENGINRYVSKNTFKFLGYHAEELIGKTVFELLHPEDIPGTLKIFQNLLNSCNPEQLEISSFRCRHANGSWRWIETSAVNMLNDPIINGVIINSRDITERKQTELLLQESIENINCFTKATYDFIWNWDTEKGFCFLNDSFYSHFKFKDIIKNMDEWFHYIYHDDKRVINCFKSFLQNSRQQVWQADYRIVSPDGEIYYVRDRAITVRNESGIPIKIIGALQDITSKKSSELKIEKINRDLQKRNQQLENFAFMMSHNLRAPVANILALSHECLNGNYPESLHKTLLENVLTSAKKLDEVIMDVHDILKIYENIHLKYEPIHLSHLINDIKIILKSEIRNANAQIHFSFDQDDLIVLNKSYLYSILYNLILNALKYHKPNHTCEVFIKYKRFDDLYQIIISDNGTGIDLNRFGDKIFGLYKRFNTKIEGKGMGLYMTKQQVEAMNGTIKVESEKGEGTKFSIDFQIVNSDSALKIIQ